MFMSTRAVLLPIVGALLFALLAVAPASSEISILNVSYDPTRELYQEFNPPSPATGRKKRAKRSKFNSRMAEPASRPVPSSMDWRLM